MENKTMENRENLSEMELENVNGGSVLDTLKATTEKVMDMVDPKNFIKGDIVREDIRIEDPIYVASNDKTGKL